MKNLSTLKENWSETKAKLKQRFASLTENDLLSTEGNQEELLNRLGAKLGKTKEEINKLIAEL